MTDRRRTRADDEVTEEEESFVARWSRRKHQARDRRTSAAPAPEPPPADESTESADSGPTDADLPPPESLDADSDYSGYLSGRVSEELRRAALRKLFRLPQFNLRDGLDDYDEDYRSFSALGDMVTADMRHHEERRREQERERLRAEQAGDAGDETADGAPGATAEASPENGQEPGSGEARGDDHGAADDPDGDPDEDPAEDNEHA